MPYKQLLVTTRLDMIQCDMRQLFFLLLSYYKTWEWEQTPYNMRRVHAWGIEGISRYPLPRNNDNSPLHFFCGNYPIVLLDNIY